MRLGTLRYESMVLRLCGLLVLLGPSSCADGSAPMSASSTSGATTEASSGTTTTPADATGSTSADTTGGIFPVEPDVGPSSTCDLFEQDCPLGEKCTVWANDGGSAPNASKCVPVVDDPAGTGEPCHTEGSPWSGVDDCDFGAMCWEVDPETLEGTCTPFCVGEASSPYCEDQDRFCPIYSDGAIVLCVPRCSPLQASCGEGRVCIPHSDDWMCASDQSGDMGAYGDPCELVNVCDPGLLCLGTAAVPRGLPCEGAVGCCTEICDISDPLGDAQCTGAVGGQTCQAWYEEGTAPQGYDDVGVCALP